MTNEHANLLPHACRRKQLIARGLRFWTMCTIAIAAICATVSLVQFILLQQQRSSLAALEAEAAPLRGQLQRTTKLNQQLTLLTQRESLLRALDRANHPLQLLGIVSKAAAVNTGKLRISEMTLESTALRQNATPTADPNGSIRARNEVELRLSGISKDNQSVARFVNLVRSENVFDAVNLDATDNVLNGDNHSFHVNCRYEQ